MPPGRTGRYKGNESFSFDQLINDSGVLLRSEISKGVEVCVSGYLEQMEKTLANHAPGTRFGLSEPE